MVNFIKKLKITASCCALLLPFTAFAGDLVIVNHTSADSTAIVLGACSTILGPIGTTKAHTTNIVPQKVMEYICLADKKNCKSEIHMEGKCKGPGVAEISMNVFTGITAIKNYNVNGYLLVASVGGYTVDIYGGPEG